MKKKKFSLIALSLGVLLAFPVIGCGGEEATPSQQECASNADCADPALPICDNGTCVAAPASNCPEGKFEINGACYAEGDECDPEDETLWGGICTGNKAVYCEDVGSDASGNRIYEIVVMNCGDYGDAAFCDIAPEYNKSVCFLPCDAAGELIFMCNPGNEDYEFDLLGGFYCVELADGSFGAVYDGDERCPAGCDATLNECIVPSCTTSTDCPSALPICDDGACVANCPDGEYEIGGACYAEGDECDPDVHGDICSGDKSVYCNPTNKKIAVMNCATYITGTTCGMITSQFSQCVMPGCDTGGEKFDMCDATPGSEGRLMTYSCKELENGDVGGTLEDYKMCANGCDATLNACIAPSCTSNADCTDTALPICDNGTCVANCPDGKYEINGACYASGDECDSDDETLSYGICGTRKAVYCESQVIQVDNCRGACGVDSTAGGMRCLF